LNDQHLRRLTTALALVGAGIAGYLLVVRYTHTSISCTSGGCETVQSSRYAELAGIPVAVLGLLLYLCVVGLSLSAASWAHAAVLALALAGVAFSGYLLYAQLALIHAICDWCLANDGIVTILVAVTLLRLRTARQGA
jgi:uncharacterized membrane protein